MLLIYIDAQLLIHKWQNDYQSLNCPALLYSMAADRINQYLFHLQLTFSSLQNIITGETNSGLKKHYENLYAQQ